MPQAEEVFSKAIAGGAMTGPSATADIEGVLIHGAQGIRSLTIVAVAPSQL
jgi:L-lactate dehydrogenase complex protein LldG